MMKLKKTIALVAGLLATVAISHGSGTRYSTSTAQVSFKNMLPENQYVVNCSLLRSLKVPATTSTTPVINIAQVWLTPQYMVYKYSSSGDTFKSTIYFNQMSDAIQAGRIYLQPGTIDDPRYKGWYITGSYGGGMGHHTEGYDAQFHILNSEEGRLHWILDSGGGTIAADRMTGYYNFQKGQDGGFGRIVMSPYDTDNNTKSFPGYAYSVLINTPYMYLSNGNNDWAKYAAPLAYQKAMIYWYYMPLGWAVRVNGQEPWMDTRIEAIAKTSEPDMTSRMSTLTAIPGSCGSGSECKTMQDTFLDRISLNTVLPYGGYISTATAQAKNWVSTKTLYPTGFYCQVFEYRDRKKDGTGDVTGKGISYIGAFALTAITSGGNTQGNVQFHVNYFDSIIANDIEVVKALGGANSDDGYAAWGCSDDSGDKDVCLNSEVFILQPIPTTPK